MKYDGKLLALARERLEAIRADNVKEHQRRIDEVYFKDPTVAAIDAKLRRSMADLLRVTLAGGDDLEQKLAQLREENLTLQMRRAERLTEDGYPIDYLAEIYSCPKCHDSGVFEGGVCSCLEKLYNAELTRSLGALGRSGECFENFDLTLYDDTPIPGTNTVPRVTMKKVLEGARLFAENFGEDSPNLLLQGGTGLGKTYLSGCIARVVAAKGCSVCYDSAINAINSFEEQKFKRSEEADARVRRMLQCDLMILDDLGTEMNTPMSESALYQLLNTRLSTGKKTVVSTNLQYDELEKRYSPQLYSRLRGEFGRLPFVGSDIRLKKH